MWELTGPSSGPFPNACPLCAMELDHARPVGRFCDVSAFERCQQLGDVGGDAARLVGGHCNAAGQRPNAHELKR